MSSKASLPLSPGPEPAAGCLDKDIFTIIMLSVSPSQGTIMEENKSSLGSGFSDLSGGFEPELGRTKHFHLAGSQSPLGKLTLI